MTHAQNMQNAGRTNKKYSSRFRGVSWDSQREKWLAKVKLDGKQYYLGRYDSEEEANAVVTEWRRKNMEFSEE